MKVALTGSTGFVGTRIVEKWFLSGSHTVIPIARSYGSLASIAKFKLDPRIANVCNAKAVRGAIEGCDAVVHAALGDPRQIVQMSRALCKACQRTKPKKLIVLSSAVSLGMIPPPGSDETSPTQLKGPLDYCSAKAESEQIFLRWAQRQDSTQVILLRPFLVYGPRSQLIHRIAQSIEQNKAWIIQGGKGVFNGIYVDNLIHAIEQALSLPSSEKSAIYHLNDVEPIHWQDLYQDIARHIGQDSPQFTLIDDAPIPPRKSFPDRVKQWTSNPFSQLLLKPIPGRLKRIVKASIAAFPNPRPSNPWQLPAIETKLDSELLALQQCNWRFSPEKAATKINFTPPVSYQDGLQRTMDWYKWMRDS